MSIRKILKEIKNDPDIYMRGHDAYDYLKYYLKKEHDISFNAIEGMELYKAMVSEMDVYVMQLDK